ncbi:hypothetical protein N7528_002605 [Penicillium herquei]|nr:hypothetical protein N7528_002605 [Penicillium herquei]
MSSIWDYYNEKSILLTGGSGFLGTALVHRLLTSTSVSRVYVICRGGAKKLEARWKEWMPSDMVRRMCDSNRLIVLDGDILLSNLGLSKFDLDILRHDTEIVIHAASSINLGKRLDGVFNSIVEASQMMFNLALSCPNLDRFVYVSTAYSNAHLYSQSPGSDIQVEEKIYYLKGESDVLEELDQVRKHGTSKTYQKENFPWSYAYAKHLTERLLLHRFNEVGAKEKLLIVRPSIIGPSLRLPFPGYIMPMSSPCTMGVAIASLYPFRTLKIATQMAEPELDVHVDEVPVDVVVDRLLCHLAMGTYGCFHAVSGVNSRIDYNCFVNNLRIVRRFPWGVWPVWLKEDWKSRKQFWASRIYAIIGVSFAFADDKTIALSKRLSDTEKLDLQLFSGCNFDVTSRAESIRYIMDQFAAQSWLAWIVVWLLYSDLGKGKSHHWRSVKL